MAVGQIQIRTEPAKLNYEFTLGRFEMKMSQATMTLRQPKADLKIEQPLGKVVVDSSRAWDALGLGGNLETMHRIYSASKSAVMEAIARIVDNGNRMGNIAKNKSDAVPELAIDWRRTFPAFDTVGEAGPRNVDVRYEPGNLRIDAQARPVEMNSEHVPAQVEYHRGKRDMYMASYGKVEIIPPQIDIAV